MACYYCADCKSAVLLGYPDRRIVRHVGNEGNLTLSCNCDPLVLQINVIPLDAWKRSQSFLHRRDTLLSVSPMECSDAAGKERLKLTLWQVMSTANSVCTVRDPYSIAMIIKITVINV